MEKSQKQKKKIEKAPTQFKEKRFKLTQEREAQQLKIEAARKRYRDAAIRIGKMKEERKASDLVKGVEQAPPNT